MRFVGRSEVRSRLEGKTIAVVGSGPGVLGNEPGFIDAHDVVLRVNNYKLSPVAGRRTDVFYSFFGKSIRKTAEELKRDGVYLCMCKCPNAHAIESEWHRVNDKMTGVDFRWIYGQRASWWFCDTFVPSREEFLATVNLLGGHVPTTGFAAILGVLSFNPRSVYLTGFDFFSSGVHNVDEPWRAKNVADPIRHRPDLERKWLVENASSYPITVDRVLAAAMKTTSGIAA